MYKLAFKSITIATLYLALVYILAEQDYIFANIHLKLFAFDNFYFSTKVRNSMIYFTFHKSTYSKPVYA